LWTVVDAWHACVDRAIGRYLGQYCKNLDPPPSSIANIGSGGRTYDVFPERQVHVDLLPRGLVGKRGIVAQAELLPLRAAIFDIVMCVGSVINHGNAELIIREIARILRPGGVAIIEFESCDGLHRLGHQSHDGTLAEAFFNGRMLIIAEYSRSFIESIMASTGLVVEDRYAFHIASGLLLRLGLHPDAAARFFPFDALMRASRSLRYRGYNLIIAARRSEVGIV
jgi:SAM-dependent methyltransferase